MRTRVLLGPMPAILRDILDETFGSQDDVILVGTCNEDSALRNAVDSLSPDVVVVGVEQDDRAFRYADLFREHPSLRLLGIRNDARSAAMHEFRVRRCRVADLSSVAILSAVRDGCDGIWERVSASGAGERA